MSSPNSKSPPFEAFDELFLDLQMEFFMVGNLQAAIVEIITS